MKKFNLFIASLAGLLTALATSTFFPDVSVAREVALTRFFANNEAAINWRLDVQQSSPEEFCKAFTGVRETAEVDCSTGRSLFTYAILKSSDYRKVLGSGRTEIAQMLTQYLRLAEILANHSDTDLYPIAIGLQRSLYAWQTRLYSIEHPDKDIAEETLYAALFQLMLEIRGVNYNASADRFKSINWHIARLADEDPAVFVRGSNLVATAKSLPYILGFYALVVLYLALTKGSFLGVCVITGWLIINWWGLLVVTDASTHFGEGSILFTLNPLGNQITRQTWIFGLSGTLIALLLSFPRAIGYLLCRLAQNLWISLTLFVTLIPLGYFLLGPAMGSEALKVTTAVFASLMTFRFGRAIYLTNKWSPKSLNITRVLGSWKACTKQPISAEDVIARELGVPLLQLAVFGAISLGFSALIFNDLGASLVSTFVLVAGIYIVFGRKIAVSTLALLGLVAILVSQTNKIQERIALMTDPLTASVSDFARLMAFSAAGDPAGFPLGKINWCSQSGVCLPLQALSDYMPIVLVGLFGSRLVAIYFLLFTFLLTLICYSMLRNFIVEKGTSKAIAALAFYLVLLTVAQTVVTFLGNWRLIPLTGIGAPLLSIGVSSAFIPALAAALTIHVWSPDAKRQWAKGVQ